MAKTDVFIEPVAPVPETEAAYVYTGEKNYEPPKVDPWVIEENYK